MVLEHSKTIGARKLTKNDMDHATPNFRVFLAYGTPEKIVRDTETQRGTYPGLIWPFQTPRRKWFFVPEYGLGDRERSPSPSRSKIRRSKFKLIYTKKETQGRSKVGGRLEAHKSEVKRNSK